MTAPAAAPGSLFDEFLDRYTNDPELYVREVLGVGEDVFVTIKDGPDEGRRIQVGGIFPNQLELLQAYRDAYKGGKRRITKKSGHRVGKTTALAWIINHHMDCRFRQKTVCTAPTTKQLFDALYAETVTWFNQKPKALQDLFEVKSEEIVLRAAPKESFASFRTSSADKPEALAGVHSDYVLLIIDEASGVAEPIFESADGSMAGRNAVTILAGNPVRTSGTFYESHTKAALEALWHRIHVSSENHPNVTYEFVQNARAKYGVDSDQYRVRVLGQFPKGESRAVIPFELLESALHRDVKPLPVRPIWGVDVGLTDDPACWASRTGNVLTSHTEEFRPDGDPMKVVAWIKGKWDGTLPSQRPSEINVDSIGVGAGVAYRLMELGLPARAINVSESPAMVDQFPRLRDELWWKGREYFFKRDCCLSGDSKLADELGRTHLLPPTTTGKTAVEPKKVMMKRTRTESPNRADAFLLTLASEAITASGTDASPISWKEPLRREIKGIV